MLDAVITGVTCCLWLTLSGVFLVMGPYWLAGIALALAVLAGALSLSCLTHHGDAAD